jgi:hypothetical protein
MNQLHLNITKLYSEIHTTINYTNNCEVSFEGSQKQCEFFKAWDFISDFYSKNKKSELTFLEVGAWKGLWGLAFYEFCKLNNIKGHYVTVTWIDHNVGPNKQLLKVISYLNENGLKADLVDGDSTTDECVNKVKSIRDSYDMVFIDASHEYKDVVKDIPNYGPMAKDVLMFHDIRPEIGGVYNAMQYHELKLDEEIIDSQDLMGIGIKYIK